MDFFFLWMEQLNIGENEYIELNTEDFDKICRTCLSKTTLQPINEIIKENANILESLKYLGIQIEENEAYPKGICLECRNYILKIYKFAEDCNVIQKILESVLSQYSKEVFKNTNKKNVDVEKTKDDEHKLYEKQSNKNLLNTSEVIQNKNISIAEFGEVKIEVEDHAIKLEDIENTNKISFPQLRIDESIFINKSEKIKKSKKQFLCPFCGKMSNLKSNMESHIRTHTKEKPYRCAHCDKTFSQQSGLTQHTRVHTGEKPYICPYCKKMFTSSSILAGHIRTHNKEKPFSCEHCEQEFAQRHHLKAHNRKHTGEKPYACPHCEKMFSLKVYLVCHIRTHTGEKPYACRYCEKRFSQKHTLTVHTRMHVDEKPFQCEDCKKLFRHKNSLDRHFIFLHGGNKAFCCDICGKNCFKKIDFLQHIQEHNEEKPLDM